MTRNDSRYYVPPQAPIDVHVDGSRQEARPSFKGQVSDARVTMFGVIAVVAGGGIGYLVYTWTAGAGTGIVAGLLVMLGIFTGYYVYDSLVSTGYMHKRLETALEMEKLDAIAYANDVNEQQAAQIQQLWEAHNALADRVDGLGQIRVTDSNGTRTIGRYDEIDGAIDNWLTGSMFDATGKLAGVYPKNMQLVSAYPFRGTSQIAQLAHARLLAAGLVGKVPNSNNLKWTGPGIYSEALDKLRRHRGQER
ncbi:MAG: hypothetical protein U0X20_07910 [Caldilineaceae bacterium]